MKRRGKKTTDIEKKVGSWLRGQKINFRREYRIDYFSVDFFIPSSKLVIQTDGCYWHYNSCDCNKGRKPTNTQMAQTLRDKACNGVMRARGYKVLRLWGCKILNDWETCEKQIVESLQE